MEKKGVRRIAILGAESTGKTSLCEALAEHYETVWVPEYAREYFNHSDIYNYTTDDLVAIAKKQLEIERAMQSIARRFLFSDTSLITLKIWADLEFKNTPDFISEHLADIKYDHYLICNNDLPWEKDEQRQNKFSRELIFDMNRKEVQELSGNYSIIKGTETERLKNAIEIIEGLKP